MKWYVTCQYCGQKEKYRHPKCRCLEKKRSEILQKITEATVITNLVKREIETPGYVFLYTRYKKGVEFFWVRIVLENGYGEWHLNELIKFQRVKYLFNLTRGFNALSYIFHRLCQ